MGDAMATNKTKIVKNRKQRTWTMVDEDVIPPEKLIDVSKEKSKIDFESDDMVAAIEKRRKSELSTKTVHAKRMVKPRTEKKEKGETEKRKRIETVEPSSCPEKGPGSVSKKRRLERMLTKAERVHILKTQKILSGRVFDPQVSV